MHHIALFKFNIVSLKFLFNSFSYCIHKRTVNVKYNQIKYSFSLLFVKSPDFLLSQVGRSVSGKQKSLIPYRSKLTILLHTLNVSLRIYHDLFSFPYLCPSPYLYPYLCLYVCLSVDSCVLYLVSYPCDYSFHDFSCFY